MVIGEVVRVRDDDGELGGEVVVEEGFHGGGKVLLEVRAIIREDGGCGGRDDGLGWWKGLPLRGKHDMQMQQGGRNWFHKVDIYLKLY